MDGDAIDWRADFGRNNSARNVRDRGLNSFSASARRDHDKAYERPARTRQSATGQEFIRHQWPESATRIEEFGAPRGNVMVL